MKKASGAIALLGGGEWTEPCRALDSRLLHLAESDDVLVLPTAAAFENPDDAVDRAAAWFEQLGAKATGLSVLNRRDAEADANVAAMRVARFVYLADGSPLHLRSVLKDTPMWEALADGWRDGAVIAGSSAGAMVLCDPMVDPRGGAFTLGLGLLANLAVIPAHNRWSEDAAHRTLKMSPPGLALVGIDERTALIREADGTWRTEGAGSVAVFQGGRPADLSSLPG